MSKLRIRTLAMLGLVVSFPIVCTSGAVAQDAPPPIAFDLSDSYALSVDNAPVRVVIPITPSAGVNPGSLTYDVVGVDADQATSLKEFFKAELDADKTAVTLTVGKSTPGPDQLVLPRPGTYQLQLTLPWEPAPAASPQGKSPVVAIAKIDIPTAVIAVTPKLEVHEKVACIFDLDFLCIGDTDTDAEELTVRETSGKADTGPLKVTLSDAAQPDHGKSIQVSGSEGSVGRGGTGSLPYTVSGDIDTGSASATVEVGGARLAAPASVDVTVTRRQRGLTFAIVVGLGLVVGFVVRGLIVRHVAKGDALKTYNEERSDLVKAWQQAADQKLRDDIAEVIKTLDTATKTAEPEDIPKHVETAKTSLVGKKDDYTKRLATVRSERSGFAESLVPLGYEPLHAPIEKAKAALIEIDKLLGTGNASQAQTSLDELRTNTHNDLIAAGQQWVSQVVGALDRLGPTNSLPAEALAELGDRADILRKLANAQTVNWAQLPALVGDTAAAEQALRRVFKATVDIGQFVSEHASSYVDADLSPAVRALDELVAKGDTRSLATVDAAERVGKSIDRTLQSWCTAQPTYQQASTALARHAYRLCVELLESPSPDAAYKTDTLVADADARGRVLGGADESTLEYKVDVPAVPPTVPPSGPPAQSAELKGHPKLNTALKVVLWLTTLLALMLAAALLLPVTMEGTRLQQLGLLVWAASLPPTLGGLWGELTKLAPAPK